MNIDIPAFSPNISHVLLAAFHLAASLSTAESPEAHLDVSLGFPIACLGLVRWPHAKRHCARSYCIGPFRIYPIFTPAIPFRHSFFLRRYPVSCRASWQQSRLSSHLLRIFDYLSHVLVHHSPMIRIHQQGLTQIRHGYRDKPYIPHLKLWTRQGRAIITSALYFTYGGKVL